MQAIRRLIQGLKSSPDTAATVKRIMRAVGYDPMHWTRVVPYRKCSEAIRAMRPETLDVLEISAGQYWQGMGFGSFTAMDFPDYDICRDRLDRQFDLIIADNVFEHLAFPYRAAKNVLAMLKPGGTFLTLTPFLIRYHPIPIDCTRWTELGMRNFLIETGFDADSIDTDSWGNRACVRANLDRWARRGWFGSLKNEPDCPVTVWAFARAPAEPQVDDAPAGDAPR